MFDDQSINTNNSLGQVPNNLPLGEPDDIFAGAEELDNEPEKIDKPLVANNFSSALGAGVLKPKNELAPQAETVNKSVNENVDSGNGGALQSSPVLHETYDIKEPVLAKVFLIILILLVVVGLGAGGWWAYGKYVAKNGETVNLEDSVSNNQAENNKAVNTENNKNTAQPQNSNTALEVVTDMTDNQVLFGEQIDTDGDTIDDETEKKIGTDPNNWDTDGDNLSDGDEVKIWKTDPLKADTDGDGYKDGDEVKNGYNPLGAGKLFEPPTSTP